MSYIEDKVKEFDKLFPSQEVMEAVGEGEFTDCVAVGTEFIKKVEPHQILIFLRTSLEEYRKEFMSCIPEKRSKHGIYGENLATDWTMGFDDARQELLSKISKKGL